MHSSINPNPSEAERFLTTLDEEAETFLFQTVDDSEAKRPELARTLAGSLEDLFPQLVELNRQGAGIFVTVNEVAPGKPRRNNNIIRVRAVFADFDNEVPPVTEATIPPHIRVRSSGGKEHWYWMVDGLPLEDFSAVQQAIAARLGSDPKVKDLARVMRLPGFFHQKDPSNPQLVEIIEIEPLQPYSADAVRKSFPPVEKSKAQGTPGRKDEGAADRYAKRAFDSGIAAIATAAEGTRNDTLNRDAHGLFGFVKAGRLDQAAVVAALENAARGVGLAEAEIKATLKSTWEAATPRHVGETAAEETAPNLAAELVAHLSKSLSIEVTEADLTDPRPEVLAKVRANLEARIGQARIDRRTTRRTLIDEVQSHGFHRTERKALFKMVRKAIQGGALLDRDFRKLPIGKREARRIVNRIADIARTLMERSEKVKGLQTTDPATAWQHLVETASARIQAAEAAKAAEKAPVITINGTPWTDPPESGTHVRVHPPRDEARPCFACYLNWWELRGRKMRPGVYYHGLKEQKGDNPPIPFDEWICSPLLIVATTRDIHGGNYGRLLWYQVEGRWKSWNMPMALLGGDGTDVRRELLRDGVLIAPKARHRLMEYLTAIEPKRKYRAALEVGWHGGAFVLPDQVFGASDIHFQSEKPLTTDFSQAGTLEDWQRKIAIFAVGNAPIAFAIAAAFAGPLLDRVHLNWGGFHYLGGSSIGKTTGLQAAASVWGGPAFMRTWHATANGMEAAAAESNDTVLILDEIGQVSPREVGNVIYALGNGVGKSRAIVTGHAKAVRRWQTILLSSGEKSLAAVIAEGGSQAMAGQEVRLLSIPVDSFRYGAFDKLHGFQDGKHLSGHIKRAVKTIYGTAGRAFLAWLVDHLDRDFEGELKTLADTHFQTTEPQEGRAANVFALIALAGELAIEADILPWPEGTAIDAAKTLWTCWREYRGRGPAELRKVVEALQSFIARFRDRFEDLDEPAEQRRIIPDRAGWKRSDCYYFIPAVFQEAIGGQEPIQAKRLLREAGYLRTGRARGFGYSLRYGPGKGDTQTCVCISNSILAATFESGHSGHSGHNQENSRPDAVSTLKKW